MGELNSTYELKHFTNFCGIQLSCKPALWLRKSLLSLFSNPPSHPATSGLAARVSGAVHFNCMYVRPQSSERPQITNEAHEGFCSCGKNIPPQAWRGRQGVHTGTHETRPTFWDCKAIPLLKAAFLVEKRAFWLLLAQTNHIICATGSYHGDHVDMELVTMLSEIACELKIFTESI